MAGLVYIAALAPDETETSQGEQEKFPVTDAFQQSRLPTGASGCSRQASGASPVTCPKKNRR